MQDCAINKEQLVIKKMPPNLESVEASSKTVNTIKLWSLSVHIFSMQKQRNG
jgi:hypothetical protein